ncbi:hypothetical protein KAR34_02290, partial [bacterium]|nr:hypothetical protein [bacterium]
MSKNTLQIFSTELGKLLFPLQQGFSSIAEAKALVEALGWQLPPGVDDLQLTAINVGDVVEKLKAILDSTSAEKEDDLLMATRYGELLVAITELISGIKTAMNTFSNLPGLTVDYLNTTQLHQKFFIRLIDLLIIRYFERNFYWFFSSLQLIGVFELEAKAEEPALFQSEHTRYTIFYDRLPRIFTEPAEVFAEVYGWGNANYDPQKLLNNLGLFFQSFGGQYRLGRLIRKAEEQFLARQVPEADADPMPMMSMSLLQGLAWDDLDVGLNFFGLRSSAPGGNDGGLGLVPYIKGTPEISFQLMENLFLEIETTLDIQGGLALFLRPGQGLQLKSGLLGQGTGSALASGKLMFEIRLGSDESEPVGLLGIPGGSGLYAQKLFMKSGAGVSDSRDLDIIIEGGIAGGKIILTAGEGDGFLQKVLPGDPMEIEFDLTIGVSSQKGFYIKGGAGLAYTFHINKQIGPILINS